MQRFPCHTRSQTHTLLSNGKTGDGNTKALQKLLSRQHLCLAEPFLDHFYLSICEKNEAKGKALPFIEVKPFVGYWTALAKIPSEADVGCSYHNVLQGELGIVAQGAWDFVSHKCAWGLGGLACCLSPTGRVFSDA